jgi:hypothetical protein
VTEKLQRPIQLWHLILSFLLTIVTTTGAVSVQYGTREAEFAQAKRDIDKLKEDRDGLKSDMVEIKNDVKWIRELLENRK